MNAFNENANEDVLSRRADSEDYGVASGFVLPRRVMLGAKFTF